MSMREIRIEENGIFIQWLIDGEGPLSATATSIS